jgi:hypothetical protein
MATMASTLAVFMPKAPSPMDHLPAPHTPVHPPVEVHDLSVEEYDGGPFLEYPSRKGWTDAQLNYPPTSGHSGDKIAQFFQTWLWFGLLFEFFRRPAQIADFVVHTADGKSLLSTRNLNSLISTWILREEKFSKETRRKRAAHLNKVLWSVHRVLSVWGQIQYDPFPGTWVTISLSILGETLDRAWKVSYLDLTPRTRKQSTRSERADNWPVDAGRIISMRMSQNGWCQSAIRKLSGPQTTAGMYFASRMQIPGLGVSHSRCSANTCVAYQKTLLEYKTKHRTEGCRCEDIFTDNEKVIAILERGKIPVVSFTEKGGICVLEATVDTKYVAISHVWSDGLGNPSTNSLPQCQMRHLSALLAQDQCDRTLFWLDTLCCPIGPKTAKNQAIALMRKTYQEADKVLVLDSYLQSQPFSELSKTEAFFMIHISQWSCRLWTLEECILGNRNLLFQFDGGILDHQKALNDSVIEYTLSEVTNPYGMMESNLAVAHALGVPSGVPVELFKIEDSKTPLRDKLLSLQKALQDRQTSDPADEPVCLANLLGLDVRAILESPKNKRMEVFWSLITDIPSDIIFWMRDRLSTKGYRWAPSTLLNGLGFLGAIGGDSNYGVVGVGLGLYVTFPGWMLGCAQGTHIQVLFRFVDGSENCYVVTCFNKNFDGTAATIGEKFINPWKVVDVSDPNAELALITRSDLRHSLDVEEFDAALVIITERKGNVNYARKVSHASVKKQDRRWIGQQSMNTLNSLQQQFRGRSMPKKWCAGNNEGSIQYTDFMSGEATDGEVFWCVD